MRSIRKRIKELKSQSVSRFIDSKDYSNYFSDLEIINHGILEHEALKYLYGIGYITSNEITVPNGKRVDVAGFNIDNNVIIIEAKASMQDFLQDTKWEEYLDYWNEFYFIFGSWSFDPDKVMSKINGSGAGVLIFDKENNNLKALMGAKNAVVNQEIYDMISVSIVKRANKKLIKGF